MVEHIRVAGAGYVGLVSAVLYAQKGNSVSIYEKDEVKRKAIASGEAPFFEPDLNQLLTELIHEGRLEVATDAVPPGPLRISVL